MSPSSDDPRCSWCLGDAEYIDYHDNQWGVPLHDDRDLFEMLTLEGAQAGLSWLTILKKRPNYRVAFAHFDIATVAAYTDSDIERLMTNPGIVRNRLKITSTIRNARGILQLIDEFGSFDRYLWAFVNGQPIINHWRTLDEVPAQTTESQAMSRDLKKRGFNFVGPTICYALMQSIGMVNDHLVSCPRHAQLNSIAESP
ncbi:DNA-3-methyladenine glycosylase I [Desulfuromonas acetoxidans]|uniref:DNA-3-methyladenine glycosylase I n=1 Tax=Desulfuromonas acetoxidans (strain DSM 684 / 11070) TaxID=281689 RepID=Q1JY99_DESA6|nr:DNA-3-methyladenine glycosylase I [Desulfuromonas acetoxidans]EAT15307.1 DNA-3-methyladenine glycosylase I [Desulfuromonas acetoxidans DSM 684]MBF0645584.1 DNA-3-methyladenine glycosylase I [Desulfuromonas acetoxidans]NVD23386.1 DNA-3-methyladenine glycosylase I [Desulfuromonas acetoxidans]NVE15373.1 DNA-3-methyladenine glycosylase I [Desulfuromonas acetoxidans]